jgi:release factor glutamine methyltransferase
MQSLLEVLRKTTAWFAEKGLESPRAQAEHIFAHVLQCRRLDLYLQFDRPLTDELLATARPLVRRRGNREPLQYILGSWSFAGLELKVDRRALIPRPETEELVEMLIERAKDAPPATILDLGTGSGALALSLAKALPATTVVATDISPEALDLARENARLHNLDQQISFRCGNWFEALEPTDGPFDWIVSNPPYLGPQEVASAEPEVRDWEPAAALSPGEDSLAALRLILAGAPRYLRPGGLLACETGLQHPPLLAQLAADQGLQNLKTPLDASQRPRFFFAQWSG